MDDSCTARLRLLRLFAYLRGHGYEDLYQAYALLIPLIDLLDSFNLPYVAIFAPFSKSGYEARLLMQFLIDFNALDAFARNGRASGSYFWKWLGRMCKSTVLDKYPCFAALVEDVVSKNNGHARFSRNGLSRGRFPSEFELRDLIASRLPESPFGRNSGKSLS
ncbi:hypothetical protein PR202_gb01512 [Eleusine coracana subsp. coracana]|uniref:Uncharacterized protein n=1 Tax=Eleusine coracana subsp. coracana TaxID=191504 RepID=A0AAV5DWT5_ELECO|nr:hypothetical protein PR202_gb01512 [Eleusine coracana subsp. coracana]